MTFFICSSDFTISAKLSSGRFVGMFNLWRRGIPSRTAACACRWLTQCDANEFSEKITNDNYESVADTMWCWWIQWKDYQWQLRVSGWHNVMLMNSTKRLPVTQCDANEFNEKITSDTMWCQWIQRKDYQWQLRHKFTTASARCKPTIQLAHVGGHLKIV